MTGARPSASGTSPTKKSESPPPAPTKSSAPPTTSPISSRMETPQKPFEKKRVVTIYGVVALLIVLALLLTLQPTGGVVFTAAKKAMVADRFKQIQIAVLSYYTEYSVSPAATDAATLVRIL